MISSALHKLIAENAVVADREDRFPAEAFSRMAEERLLAIALPGAGWISILVKHPACSLCSNKQRESGR